MKYHIKPLGMTKTQGFCQDLYGYDLFLPVGELKGILKDPTNF